MFDATDARQRRRFYLERGMRKKPLGSGSDVAYLMALPRSTVVLKPADIFGDIPVMIVGGVATRAYMPERQTKDIDFMVEHQRYAEAADCLRKAGFGKNDDLFFPNTVLGLYGESWTKNGEEVDLLSSPQEWCARAFGERVEDQACA